MGEMTSCCKGTEQGLIVLHAEAVSSNFNMPGASGVAQLLKRLTLDFGSGLDLVRLSPVWGLHALWGVCLESSLPLYPSPLKKCQSGSSWGSLPLGLYT